MKQYNIINNVLGWLCFAIAAFTYLMTVEPTASFWDCPEFITQAFKLEVGHPPGNPIFMLAGRFFVNFAGGDVTKVALMVNCMSALLSAGTILLLFWTITHLVKRLIVKDVATKISLVKQIVIFGSAICGALVYTWSDTFWFSAVEGEVYAFSSFCTALVFWLILKWENRADKPHSDRYLILIAYVIGISIAVHLLNLLCIPAIVLVIYFRKWKQTTAGGALIALLISVAIIVLILYGLVPGYIEIAQYFELLFVNVFGFSFNVGTIIYAVLLVASYIWTIYELYSQRNPKNIRLSFLISITLSGMLFIGDSLWIPVLLTGALAIYLFRTNRLPIRILNIVTLSGLVIFIGYSSYALLLIRSSANPPMNQNAPDNVFSLSSYLNREQYGDKPLLYGQTFNSQVLYQKDGDSFEPVVEQGRAEYAKVIDSESEGDRYKVTGYKKKYVMTPELNMIFPRMHSSDQRHINGYNGWVGEMVDSLGEPYIKGEDVEATLLIDEKGDPLRTQTMKKPTFWENLKFFLGYQLNHMYWRYFMWNFAGRQNDIQGNGEPNHGNWISGIPFIDNARLGDQSLLPEEEGSGNAGHNVFFMLPLILGIIGLTWQVFVSKRGSEQFWVIFFLFFMTGIAIVLYLNQTPSEPRERDYAYAGSFYAFAIWVGMGVAGIWQGLKALTVTKHRNLSPVQAKQNRIYSLTAASVGCIIGLFVPLQMVSQTWDDHDRSNRYTTLDFGANYLNSLDENAIIFTNGDNDTFPLWYAQEVEGIRPDVKVVNMSYLTTDWYADQIRMPSYSAPGIDMLAKPENYAYNFLQYAPVYLELVDPKPTNALLSLKSLYDLTATADEPNKTPLLYPNMFVPVNLDSLVARGILTPQEAAEADSIIPFNFLAGKSNNFGLYLNEILALDMIATSAKNGWNRPVYFAITVPSSYYLGSSPYLKSTGMAYELTPLRNETSMTGVNTEKMYRNVTEKWKWGGLDKVKPGQKIYLDETIRRMVDSHRTAMIDLASALIDEGYKNMKPELEEIYTSIDMTEPIDSTDVEVLRREMEIMPGSILYGSDAFVRRPFIPYMVPHATYINDAFFRLISLSNDSIEVSEKLQSMFDDEKFAKARNILTLMEEKLPSRLVKYSEPESLQIGQLYIVLGLLSNNEDDIRKGLDFLLGEIDRYGDFLRYYNSLSPDLYGNLQDNDKFINENYVEWLMDVYLAGGGDKDKLVSTLKKKKNINNK